MQFQLEMSTDDGYDYLGESLRDKLEPFMIDKDNRECAWKCDITTGFAIKGYHCRQLTSHIELYIDRNEYYDYIGDTVRDEVEDLIIFAKEKGYPTVCMDVKVVQCHNCP